MKICHLAFITCILFFSNTFSQDIKSYLKANAIKIENPDSLSEEIYTQLSDFSLIMIGEMHGTAEPAQFVYSLSRLFVNNGDSVQVGFEIPDDQMSDFINERNDSSIFKSPFFSKISPDGRASFAWAGLISKLNKDKRISIFFFDENNKQTDDRDSIMYLNIKEQLILHPKYKTITLSGNIHNMILPYKEKIKMGMFLRGDEELKITDKICALNHVYQHGTMNNNHGAGLQIYDAGNVETIYSKSVSYDYFLFLFPYFYSDSYSGIYFTRNVTASMCPGNK